MGNMGGNPGGAAGGSAPNGDGYVDADFREVNDDNK